MLIAPELSHRYLNYLNEAQHSIVSHKEGPLLVIAGPGSGKTRSLTLLAMNLLLCGDARPSELVLCTFTEKAAYEMQDRIGHLASDVDYTGDLSQHRIGTIHGICNQLISEHLQNYSQLDRVEAAELNIQIEKEDYVLTGKIDLLMRGCNGLEVMDFKTGKRPDSNSWLLELYRQQLYLYALALEKSKGQLPEKLFLYWTGEERKEDALMEIPCQSEHVEKAGCHFDDIAARIKRREFAVVKPPEPEVCRVCDIRHLCKKQGVI